MIGENSISGTLIRPPITMGEFRKFTEGVPDSATLEIIINNRQALWPDVVMQSEKHVFIEVKDIHGK